MNAVLYVKSFSFSYICSKLDKKYDLQQQQPSYPTKWGRLHGSNYDLHLT